MNKLFLLIFISLLVTGCLATADLASEEVLSTEDKLVAQKITNLGSQECVRGLSKENSNDELSSKMPLSKIIIKRFYKSDTDWFKVEAVSDGVWDNIYYNKKSEKIVCGQKTWDSYNNVKGIEFREHSVVPKKL